MKIMIICLCLAIIPINARADIFGADTAVLVQILTQTLQELIQLKGILQNGRDSLGLIRDINQGISDSLNLAQTAYPNLDPGIYREWQNASEALRGVKSIYGRVLPSPEAQIQRDTDDNVAQAVALNNSIYKYTAKLDRIGERVQRYSHAVSPGGAQKLTAESLGVIMNILNESLRAQATGLKIQAQELAIQNHKQKEITSGEIKSANTLSKAMDSQDVSFQLPRL